MSVVVWRCYRWYGMQSARSRRRFPPAAARDWRHLPHLLDREYDRLGTAQWWLWQRLAHAQRVLTDVDDPRAADLPAQYRSLTGQLLYGREVACQWGIDLPHHTAVYLAVIGIYIETPKAQRTHGGGHDHDPTQNRDRGAQGREECGPW